MQVPVTYHAVPVGEPSPLDTCAPQDWALPHFPLRSLPSRAPCCGSDTANLVMRLTPAKTRQQPIIKVSRLSICGRRRRCQAWDDAPIVTLDLTDLNIWHFMGELLLPTFHALLNLDLMPRHVARYASFC